jgi:DNA polymerase-3 subunit delta'
MKFASVIGHQEVKKRLIQSAKDGRVSHALLFLGPEGSGGLPLANAFAQYLVCENRSETDSCGECPGCVKMQKLVHPDVSYSYPVASKEKITAPKSVDFVDKWRKTFLAQPYLNYLDWMDAADLENKQGIISVHESADIIQRLNLKAVEAPYKIVIIWLPEKMNAAAANKLLKILEEPLDHTLFFLVSEDYEELLPTIISRTQLVKVNRIKEDEMVNELTTHHNIDASLARRINHKANGSYSEAMQLLERADVETSFQADFLEWMRGCYKLNLKVINQYTLKLNELSRDEQKHFLAGCLDNVRECLLLNYAHRSLIKLDGEELNNLAKFAPFINLNNSDEFVEEFNKAMFHIDRNANFKILFSDLSFKVHMLLRS